MPKYTFPRQSEPFNWSRFGANTMSILPVGKPSVQQVIGNGHITNGTDEMELKKEHFHDEDVDKNGGETNGGQTDDKLSR